ncbi:hypothetical protein MJH12_14115, partial [bacterium]|nr:hypothetical protein [bacterium]
MKNVLFSLAVTCLILQSNTVYSNPLDLDMSDISQSDGPGDLTQIDLLSVPKLDVVSTTITQTEIVATVDAGSFGSSAEDSRDQWAKDTILAKDITPSDFLERSSIDELNELLKALTGLVSEKPGKGISKKSKKGKKITRLNKNKKNLKHTKKNLEGKVLWELSVQDMMDARTKGIGDYQNDKRDVKLVRDFLDSLINSQDKELSKVIWKKVGYIVSQAMPACNPKDQHKNGNVPWISVKLAQTIITSFTDMIKSKDISAFDWEHVASSPFSKNSDEAKHSYYKDAFIYGATVQVYLQLVKTELESVKSILTLSEMVQEKKLVDRVLDIKVPEANQTLFKNESSIALDKVIEAYQSEEKRDLAKLLFETFQDSISNTEELTKKLSAVESALLNLNKDADVVKLQNVHAKFKAR